MLTVTTACKFDLKTEIVEGSDRMEIAVQQERSKKLSSFGTLD
jgi:hypothetical protein